MGGQASKLSGEFRQITSKEQ